MNGTISERESKIFSFWFVRIFLIIIGGILASPYLMQINFTWSFWRIPLGMTIVTIALYDIVNLIEVYLKNKKMTYSQNKST